MDFDSLEASQTASGEDDDCELFEFDGNLDDDSDIMDLPDPVDEDEAPRKRPPPRPTIMPAPNVENKQDDDFDDIEYEFVSSDADVKHITDTIGDIILFENIESEEQLLGVVRYFYYKEVSKGDVVIKQGDKGDAFYVVKSGNYKCFVTEEDGQEKEVKTYQGAGYFGDLALLHDAPRSATVVAETDGELWVLNGLRFFWVQKKQAMQNVTDFHVAVRNLPILRYNADPKTISRAADSLEIVYYDDGDAVCVQGKRGDAMYFVLEGVLDVVIDGRVVDQINPFEFFGERSLVLNEPRAASCVARKTLRLAKLSRDCFEETFTPAMVEDMKQYIIVRYEMSIPILHRNIQQRLMEDIVE